MKVRILKLPLILLLAAVLDVNIECLAQVQRPAPDGSSHQDSNDGGRDGERIVALINGSRVITEKEVDEAIGSQVYALQERMYNLRRKALDGLVIQILLKEEAAKRGLTVAELQQRMTPGSMPVNQSDVDRVYAESGVSLDNMNEAEAKQRIRLDLEVKRRLDLYKAAIAELMDRSSVQLLLAAPVPQAKRISTEGPSIGPVNAPITIVEFSDFQCPYCRQAAGISRSLVRSYGSDVRFVFKHMPLTIHPDAFKAAQASVCADRQGKFWEYHDLLFASSELSETALKKYAADLGLKANEFNACLDSESSAAAVRTDMQEALRAEVQGTPTFFVNGIVLRGIKTLQEFRDLIDRMPGPKQSHQRKGSQR